MPNVNSSIRYLPDATANANIAALQFACNDKADFYSAMAKELAVLPRGDGGHPAPIPAASAASA